MIIRKATQKDAEQIAAYLLLAMEDLIFKFLGEKDRERATAFLQHFTERENNQYSWQNCLVAEEQNEVVAAINIYDGARFNELRAPVIHYAKMQLNSHYLPEEETQAGEMYVDALAVSPNHQGKGIGSKLLQIVIDEYVVEKRQILGLLVDEDNPSAKSIYIKLGFRPVGKKMLAGKHMEHLRIGPSRDSC